MVRFAFVIQLQPLLEIRVAANRLPRQRQNGIVLIEALIALLIFSIGILATIGLQATAISAQSDAQYRIEASNLVDRMIGEINLNVNRSSATTLQNSLAAYSHQPSGSNCNFSGSASTNTMTTNWLTDVAAQLPGTSAATQQIIVNTGTFNQVSITLCWRNRADFALRRHTVIAYIN